MTTASATASSLGIAGKQQTNKQVNTFVYITVLVRNFMSLILRWGSNIVTTADNQLTGLTIVIFLNNSWLLLRKEVRLEAPG